MALLSKKSAAKVSGCTGCSVGNILSLVLLAVATVASAIGVYKAHVLSTGATFGTSNGSLSLIAFVLAVTLLHKACRKCCGCSCEMKK